MSKRDDETQTAFTLRLIRAEAWDLGYRQAVRDHRMRDDDEAFCGWPTTTNPYASLVNYGVKP